MSAHETAIRAFARVTPVDRHAYFGYYDKFPWDATSRYLLALSPTFIDRQPTANDSVEIGMIDLEDGNRWIPVAETHAWNWQQGTMLHWLPKAPTASPDEQEIVFNERVDAESRFGSVVLNPFTGKRRSLPRPIYCLRPDGKQALSVNFARIAHTRPGYGYEGIPDRGFDVLAPEDDGIWSMDMTTGETLRITSIREMTKLSPKPDFPDGKHWFNHLQYNTDGSRFIFLHRWGRDGGVRWGTRMLTANPDGTDVRIIADDGMTSHFDWRDPAHILAWARQNERGDHYYLFDARTGDAELVGGDVLTTDGHCSYSPNREWVLTDTYPDKTHHRTLILYHPKTDTRVDIGRFYSPPEVTGPFRCDLHPRWSRDGRSVCVDSAHESMRGMYVASVADVVG